ncbi:exonuclease subunit SbcD [Burkholderia sp. Ac-20365]|uniref:exonuclease subunit SbcD n=1 Tax=Burkholderia sp. Ac-20365 TaxID=2703897 RepID=UPI00197B1137|nr:exonuclease subunit SbcD [Burkholderia sp. Ac-20365]MBN3767591.1 exonuclease subunit SbcD [Burkholderia sp. Ac-20365]
MRILHTSDWHLGQNFMGKSRQAEHQALIDWLITQVDSHHVDAVIVAGDIFDTGTPPSYARELYSQLVVKLHAAGVSLMLLGGNHDSVATLRESSALLECLSTTVTPSAAEPARQVRTLPLRRASRSGEVGSEVGCIVCAIPFIRPRDVIQSEAGESAEQKLRSLQESIQRYYHDVYQAAVELQTKLSSEQGRNIPIIGTGHLTTVGASASDSVREIYVGALEAFPTNAFPPFDYLALGHIHRPQKVGGHEHIRYSGSPIALSFDESSQQKEVLLVDVDENGLRAVTPLTVPTFQTLVAIKGNLKSLAAEFKEIAQHATDKPVWVEVTVSEDDYLTDLPARVQELVEDLPIELLRIRRQRGNLTTSLTAEAGMTLDELSPHDVFERRLDSEEIDETLKTELRGRYKGIVASLLEKEA